MDREVFLKHFYALEIVQIDKNLDSLIKDIQKVSENLSEKEKLEFLGNVFLHPKSIFSFDNQGIVTNKESLWSLYTSSAKIAKHLGVKFSEENALRFLPVLQQNTSQNEVVIGILLILNAQELIQMDSILIAKFLLRQAMVDAKYINDADTAAFQSQYKKIFANLPKHIFENAASDKNKWVDTYFWVAEQQLNIMDRYFVEFWEKKEFNDFKNHFYQTEFGKSFVDELLMKRNDIEAFKKGVEKLLLEVAKSYDSQDPFYPLKSILLIINQKIKLSQKYKPEIERLNEKKILAKILVKQDFKVFFSKLPRARQEWLLACLQSQHSQHLGFV